MTRARRARALALACGAVAASLAGVAAAEPEPVSLVKRPIVLGRGEIVVIAEGSVGRTDTRYDLLTTAAFDVTSRLGVARGLELDARAPFSYDGVSLGFSGPGAGARWALVERPFELAARLDVAGTGLAGTSTTGAGVSITQGLEAARSFGERLRLDLAFIVLHQFDDDPTLGLSAPINATIAVDRTFFVTLATGYTCVDLRSGVSHVVSATVAVTQVIERGGQPLFDVGAFLRRPNLVTYAGYPYPVFSAGVSFAVHADL